MDPLRDVRIAAVPYLNAAPLIHCLQGVERAVPSKLAQWLDNDVCDLATLPLGAVVEHPEWRVLPSLGIAAEGPVRTVLLLHREPFGTIRAIRPDPASRSSNLLCRVLLKEAAGQEPTLSPNAASRVVIGDAAFQHDPDMEGSDLAQVWKDQTGLPMVFAGWVAAGKLAKDEIRLQEVEAALLEALRKAQNRMTEIIKEQTVVSSWTASEYLRRNIVHRLDERFRQGADLFARKAAELGVGGGVVPWA